MQKKLGTAITGADMKELGKFKPHFVCFPEYFFVNKNLGTHNQTPHNFRREHQRLEVFSMSLKSVVIGGTMPEYDDGKKYNTCFVYYNGKLSGLYRKQNLYHAEEGILTPGKELNVFSAYGIKFSVLICADVFREQYFINFRKMGVKLIFIPTFSPKKSETAGEKFKRDKNLFVHSAGLAEAAIVKVCGAPSDFRKDLQGRSLIADGNGIIFRVMPEQENEEMIILKEIEL